MESARQAFVLFGITLKILWNELWTFVVLNVLWLLLCLPIVTAPASFVALYYVADKAARDEVIEIRDFFEGFKLYFVKGSLLGLLNIIVGMLLATNLLFYGQIAAGWAKAVQILWIAVTLFWLLLQVYLLPMFVVQIEPTFKVTLRNSALLILAQPLFSVIVALEIITLTAVSVILVMPFMIISMSLIALLSCVALNDRVKCLKAKQKTLAGSEDDSVDLTEPAEK